MWPYASATLRQALRSPVSWVLTLLAVFTGWFAVTAAILAISDVQAQSESLVLSTAQLGGVLLTLWLMGRSLDEDRHSGFAAAADATSPGVPGRLLGRWAGATAAGALLSFLAAVLIFMSSGLEQLPYLTLLYTSVSVCAVAAAWALLLGTLWRGGGATLAVFLAWILGHLPWGVAPFLAGPLGSAMGAVLPGPRHGDGGSLVLGYTSAAVAGLLLLTLSLSRPADA
jgi:hypothetical protein